MDNIHAYYIDTEPLLWYHLTIPWVSHMTPVRVREGGSNASMKTTWREERAAIREWGRERPTWATETHEEEQQSSCGKHLRTRTKVRPRTRGYPPTSTRTRPADQEQTIHHVRVHQKKELQQTAPAESHQVRHMTMTGFTFIFHPYLQYKIKANVFCDINWIC